MSSSSWVHLAVRLCAWLAALSALVATRAALAEGERQSSYDVPPGCASRSVWLAGLRARLPPLLRTHPLSRTLSVLSSNIAFSSGSRERLSGAVIFPESEVTAQAPGGRFPESLSPDGQGGRALEHAILAGDLDGDGAEDLLTTSFIYGVVDDGSFALSDPQLHIHYGAPAPQTTLLR